MIFDILMVKSTLHILSTYSRGPTFDPFHGTTSHFRDIEKYGKNPFFFIFTILRTSLVNTFSRDMHESLGLNLFYTFRRDVVLKFLPMLTKTKKNHEQEAQGPLRSAWSLVI